MKAKLRFARISPKKANLVASMVRKLPVQDALDTLERLPKKGAAMLYKLIASAAANAENNASQNRRSLYIKELTVNKGRAFRRFIPISRGRARSIDKWTSHINLQLGVILPDGVEEEVEKVDAKATGKKDEKAASKKEAKNTKEMKEKESTSSEKAEVVEKMPVTESKKPSASFDSSADPHSKGAKKDQSGPTFQAPRRGDRGA